MSSYVATVVPKTNREHILTDSSMLSKCIKYEKRKKKLEISIFYCSFEPSLLVPMPSSIIVCFSEVGNVYIQILANTGYNQQHIMTCKIRFHLFIFWNVVFFSIQFHSEIGIHC